MNKLLTIIVPTYNMEAYLNRCLNSLIIADEQMQLLEVLVINDGSKDRSSEIAHQYEAKYPNTFRVIDKENGNYGSCINRGLKEATGKYIKVLDADDWFDTDALSCTLIDLQKYDVDMALTPFNIVDADTMNTNLAYSPTLLPNEVRHFQTDSYEEIGVYMMHAVIYNTQFLRNIHYTQTEGISYTDTEWVYLPLYAVNKYVYLNHCIYQYLLGREGQTMDPKVIVKTIDQHEVIARSLITHVISVPKDKLTGFSYITIIRQIEYLLQKVYKTRLVLQDSIVYDNQKMLLLDSYVKECLPTVYQRLDKLRLKKHIPLYYVRFWRKMGYRFPIDWIRTTYRKMKYGK